MTGHVCKELTAPQKTMVVVDNQNYMPPISELKQISSVCNTLGMAPFYKSIGPAGCLAIWLTAREMGIPPMAALNGLLWTFDGKVTISAQGLALCIIKAGHSYEILHIGYDYCEIKFIRGDRPEGKNSYTHRFTIQDAERAGLLKKQNWVKNTADMLYNRCMTAGCRKFIPDCTLGLNTREELEDARFNVTDNQNMQVPSRTPEQNDPEPIAIDDEPTGESNREEVIREENDKEAKAQVEAKPLQEKLTKMLNDLNDNEKQHYLGLFKTHFSINDPMQLSDKAAIAMIARLGG